MENSRYGGQLTTDVLREAREALALSTSRPETPLHTNLADLQESLSGRRTPRIIQNERRPKTGSLQTRPSRLQPIGSKERESPDNSLLRSVSVVSSLEANSTGLSQFVKTMKNSAVDAQLSLSSKLIAKMDEKPKSISKNQESILSICSSMLAYPEIKPSQRAEVVRIMKRIELGPVNLSVYGTQIYKLTRDADFFFSSPEMAECLISKISEADEMLIISLKDLVMSNPSRLVQAAEACENSLTSQIERAISRILLETERLEAEGTFLLQKGNERRVQFLLLVLRELLNVNTTAKVIEESPNIFQSCFKSLRVFSDSEDITFIVARLLSKTTNNPNVCSLIHSIEPKWILHIAQGIEKFIRSPSLIVHFLFAVGNAAVNSIHNLKFLATVRRVLSLYLKRATANDKLAKEEEDVLLKALRVCANLSLEEATAKSVLDESGLMRKVVDVLKCSVESKSWFGRPDEIARFSVTVITNTCFFFPKNSALQMEEIMTVMVSCLLNSKLSTVCEVCRALANLSREETVKSIIIKEIDLALFVTFLESPDSTLVSYTVGILTNLSSNFDLLPSLLRNEQSGVENLKAAMVEFEDWELATHIAKLFFNIVDKRNSQLTMSIKSTFKTVLSTFPASTNKESAISKRLFSEVVEKFNEKCA